MMAERPNPGGPYVADRVIKASGQFARLSDAIERTNFALDAEARAELSRLGFTVGIRIGQPPTLRPYKPLHDAAAEGGGR
jgi:hypothetical protein